MEVVIPSNQPSLTRTAAVVAESHSAQVSERPWRKATTQPSDESLLASGRRVEGGGLRPPKGVWSGAEGGAAVSVSIL